MKNMDIRKINRQVIEQFRAGGAIEGMHRERLLLLTTTGAKSGRRHTTPMMFQRDGDRILVIASNAGATTTPNWFHNVVKNPGVTVEVGDDKYEAKATPLEGKDLEKTWARIKDAFPFFAEHESKAKRTIPVLALTRPGGPSRG